MKSHKHQGFFSVDMKNKWYTVILKATLLGGTTFQLSTNLSISSCCSIYALRLTANLKTKEASINQPRMAMQHNKPGKVHTPIVPNLAEDGV